MGKGGNLGLNDSQGWEEEKTKGRIIAKGGKKRKPRAVIKAKGGKSNTSPNNHPGGCIRQVRVWGRREVPVNMWEETLKYQNWSFG